MRHDLGLLVSMTSTTDGVQFLKTQLQVAVLHYVSNEYTTYHYFIEEWRSGWTGGGGGGGGGDH